MTFYRVHCKKLQRFSKRPMKRTYHLFRIRELSPFVKGKRYIEVWPFGDLNSLVGSVEAVIKGTLPAWHPLYKRSRGPGSHETDFRSTKAIRRLPNSGTLNLRGDIIFSYRYSTTFPRSSETETDTFKLN